MNLFSITISWFINTVVSTRLLLLAYTLFLALNPVFSQKKEIPVLLKKENSAELIVDGKPMLMLAGELGNSSASSVAYMKSIWPSLVKMNLNSVLIPVYWELIEPEEGNFDFAVTDTMILEARRNNLKVVLLWFGSWKNSMSCYAPLWVKANTERFPRARRTDGSPLEILTPFSKSNRDADSRAFSALIQHIKDIDAGFNTVVMVQVENEIGMIPEARDHSNLADQAFNSAVPETLLKSFEKHKQDDSSPVNFTRRSSGEGGRHSSLNHSWEEVFGKSLSTDELFMAWYFAEYTNYVTEAGKKVYPLPMYVNAALIRPGYKPGQYPSAGPLPHLKEIWKLAAPAVDFLAPDIYFPNFIEWVGKYDFPGNPVFIPEVGNNQSLAQAFYAFGKHNALGYSPFSIESLASTDDNSVTQSYSILKQLMPLIIQNQGKGTMDGFLLDSANQKIQITLGNYRFNIRHEYSWAYAEQKPGSAPRNGGLIIMLNPDEFLIAGTGAIVTFEPVEANGSVAGIGTMDEVEYNNGKWLTGRRMNGDQNHQGRHMHLPGNTYSMQKVRLYLYK